MDWGEAAIVEGKVANHDIQLDKLHEKFANSVLLLRAEGRSERLEDYSHLV